VNFSIEIEREVDGRWIAEVPSLPGVIVYGETQAQAVAKAKALALHVIADRIEHEEDLGELVSLTFQAA
jgi:predicted RNase H-like HicB family nuclease